MVKGKEEEGEEKHEESKSMNEEVRELFRLTTERLVKVLEQMMVVYHNEPAISQKTVKEIHEKVKEGLQRTISGEFTGQLDKYFQEVLKQVGEVQEEAIKFSRQAKTFRHSSI